MMPPVFSLLSADTSLVALLGSSPFRCYPFGEAPQGVTYPYVTWQILTAIPENTLACVPSIDAITVQVDVWASSVASCLAVAQDVRDRLELSAYMVAFGDTNRMPDTRSYRYRMDFQFWTPR